MAYSNRKRHRDAAAREAAGESLWVKGFDDRALQRISALWELMEAKAIRGRGAVWLRRQIGTRMRLYGGWSVGDEDWSGEVLAYSGATADIDFLLDLFEFGHEAMDSAQEMFEVNLNAILHEHRIAFQMLDGQMVERSSDELNVEVVEPTLRLLVGAKYEKAHDAYLAALKEVTRGDPADAITDAGTALQEALVALGCSGNALGPLLKDAKKRRLLAGHDQTLVDGVSKFADWASADRSETGDAHKHSDATRADAWLMIHVVGALIVRLVDPDKPRGA